MSDFSRRTVVRGTAWTVPVIAIAAQAPAFAASNVPPPPVDQLRRCLRKHWGQQKGCGLEKTLQVPVTVSNTSAVPIVFQVTSLFTSNTGTAPPWRWGWHRCLRRGGRHLRDQLELH